jgi:predicted DNA-binding transcriptional regulator YafY
MLQKTDDEHMITQPEIIEYLGECGVTVDRKTLYEDLHCLSLFGIDVIGEKIGSNYYYHVGKKAFDIAELKLLVDAVQSSKFITEKKSRELIEKLAALCSEYEGKMLKRQVTVQGRIKAMNESIFYNVDKLHTAISNNSSITMEYYYWNTKKQLVPTDKGTYTLSPWALMWSDENYYLVAYDEIADKIKHFRVDKMKDIELTGKKRKGKDLFREFDVATYSKKNFWMFGGEDTNVDIAFRNDMVGVIIDRFGKSIMIRSMEDREGWSKTTVNVAVSDQFFGWVFGLGGAVEVLGPENIRINFVKSVSKTMKLYKEK